MATSLFFYDLETSGFSPRTARVMQFAGQRTDMSLKPVGKPVNHIIKLTPDVLPSPDAILVTGITPQRTIADGITEAEFLKIFYEQVATPDTIFAGFNSVRFDDEFMRFMMYRNFYDAYEWQWKDGRSRWDVLDVVRMTRALRPDGIKWPFAPDGRPSNRLELLSALNKLEHAQAHDALSDVQATIDVARLILRHQPELFHYLLDMRDKKKVEELVGKGEPFTYTTGRYSSEYLHTSAAVLLTKRPRNEALVYDLRHDPTEFAGLSADEMVDRWRFTDDPEAPPRLPVKTLKYNRCPAVAPLGVIKDATTQERLKLSLETVTKNLAALRQVQTKLTEKILKAVELMDAQREAAQTALVDDQLTVDGRLYDGFLPDSDRALFPGLRQAPPAGLGSFKERLHDDRLKSLLPLYKARNYPASLTSEERAEWDDFCAKQLFAGGGNSVLAKYFGRLSELSAGELNDEKRYILEELQLYGQSVVPAEADAGVAG